MANSKQPTQEVILNEKDALDFLNWEAPEDHLLESDPYPFIQWNNDVGGKWEFPLKHWAGTSIERNYDVVDIPHDFNQTTEPGMLVDQIHVARIASRSTWEGDGEDGKRVYSPVYQEGLRKRYNHFVLVKELEGADPAIITLRSYTGAHFDAAIKQHRKTVINMASKLSGGRRYPTYMFWLPLAGGPKTYVGAEKKSEIFPPTPIYDFPDLADEIIPDVLRALYIGDEYRDIISGYLFGESKTWTDEHQRLLLPPSSNIPPHIEVLPGGNLYIPDLSAEKRGDWIEAAMTIPDLFKAREHASNALAQVLRDKVLLPRGTDQTAQWEAWRNDLERRYKEMLEKQETVALEAQLQNGG